MPSIMTDDVKQEIHNPSEIYDAIVARLKAVFEASGADVSVAGYEDWVAGAGEERQVLVEVSAASGGEWLPDGRHGQIFEVVLYAVISKGCKRPALQAMDLAAQLMRLAHDARWGFSGKAVGFPERMKSEVSFLIESDSKHRGYEAWEIRWDQLLKFGAPQLGVGDDAFDPVVTSIAFSTDPDVSSLDGFEAIPAEGTDDA